ncbi:hypothetical protein HBI46_108680 [Parastagonospora nodorum]|nr:hypothetical protein HBH45_101480 [Parastagonospora nodorum]KAH4166680.1 hypothetical protein HBH44_062640 [Parastagonospora nodorum]KAH4621067.1 hypothetical protein HBH55_161390 [Parastagonospora nodorum]KAH5323906.1 hypothetical protein HBI50_100980 [Parastagonospora nodorum]KAH5418994.1 hypothetical protein HBI46_108680 [Parastagonospora nodorum]
MDFYIYCGDVWAVENQALRPDRLVFLTRSKSDREDHDALEAACRVFEVVACFANSLFGCESVLMLGDVANAERLGLPASKEIRRDIKLRRDIFRRPESIPKVCALRSCQNLLGEFVDV